MLESIFESATLETSICGYQRHMRNRILDIHQVNVFLMASPKLQLAAHSPTFKYLRILEYGAWRRYLKGAHHAGLVRGLLVYYWRHPSGPSVGEARGNGKRGAINSDNPYRDLLLDFNRNASGTWWMQIVRIILGVTIALAILQGSQTVDLGHLDMDGVARWQRCLPFSQAAPLRLGCPHSSACAALLQADFYVLGRGAEAWNGHCFRPGVELSVISKLSSPRCVGDLADGRLRDEVRL